MLKKTYSFLLFISTFILLQCVQDNPLPFVYKQDKETVTLLENGGKIFSYQKALKSQNGQYPRNNYIHPLYNLEGDTLTEDFPPDHPYHRGIYWAWHQIYIGKRRIGDSWVTKNVYTSVREVKTTIDEKKAVLAINALWESPSFRNGRPFLQENTTICVRRSDGRRRIIDFELRLQALVDSVSIGGAENEKGYGGFCARIRMPDNLEFTAQNGRVTPQRLQIAAGPWLDFSASFVKNKEISGLTLFCHPSNPKYPQPWILRQKKSMQNIVFPGKDPIKIDLTQPTILRYRLIIHRGYEKRSVIAKQFQDYSDIKFN